MQIRKEGSSARPEMKKSRRGGILWCGTESNCRHMDFQSIALPTELPHRLSGGKFKKVSNSASFSEEFFAEKTMLPIFNENREH